MTRDARDVDPGLRDPGARRRRPRDRQLGRAHPAPAGRDGRHPVRRPGDPRCHHAAAGRRPARRCCAPRCRAATRSCSSPAPSPPPPPPTSSSRSSGPCSTGTEQLDGLTIDTDLRWHLLHQLVAGRQGRRASRWTASSTRDDTATGRRQAAAALAARPRRRREGRGVVGGRRRRRAAERHPDRGDRRLRPAPASWTCCGPTSSAVLRRAHDGVGGADQRDRAEHRDRPVPDPAGRAGHGRRARTRGWRAPRTRRRPCAGWSASPATAWPAPCGPKPATPAPDRRTGRSRPAHQLKMITVP